MAGLAAVVVLHSQSSAPPAISLPVAPPAPRAATPPVAPAPPLVRRGIEAAQSGAAGEAAELFRRAIAANPSDPETWNNLGVVLARQGEVTEAADAFRRALRLEPRHAEAHRNLAVVLDRRGQPAEATAHYRAFLSQGSAAHPDRDGVERRLAEIQKARR